MNNDKKKISTNQLMFSVVCFMAGSTLPTKHIYSIVKHEAWVVVIVGLITSLPIIWMYAFLAKKFPGMSIIEINDTVFGCVFGKLFSVLYIFFFLTITLFNNRDIGTFVAGYILPETPMTAVIVMFFFACAYAVRKGAKTITSYSTLFFIILVAILMFLTLLLIDKIKLENFLPLFSLPVEKYLDGSHVVVFLPICEIFAFFMLFPSMKNPQDASKALWGGLAIGAVIFLFVITRDTAVLGSFVFIETIPSFSVIRLINIGNILTRLEVLYAILLIMLLFFKVSILFYASVYGISKILNLKSYKFLVPTFAVIVVVFSFTVFKSSFEEGDFGVSGVAGNFAMIFELVLPVITLIIAAIRGFLKKKVINS